MTPEYLPVGQAEHVRPLPDMEEAVPAVQASHEVDPVEVVNVPAGQLAHFEAP